MPKDYPDHPVMAVGAVVFRLGHVLMVQRRDPPSAGLWAIPGGSLRLGETLQQAAEREIHEETGIRIRAGRPIHIVDVIDRDASGRVRYHYVITDLEAEYLAGDPHPADDALRAAWLSPEQIRDLPVNDSSRHLLIDELGFTPAT